MPKTLTCFDYHEEVQPVICKHLGIEEKYFRKYHEVVGGNHKDFWHVFVDLFDHTLLGNDSYFKMWTDFGDPSDYYVDSITKKYGEWSLKLYEAVNATIAELACVEDRECETEILVWISW